MPCIGNVPSIVASGSIVKSSGGNISATTLFTPSAAGLFRVSVYLDGPTGAAGNTGASISWTDSNGAASVTLQLANNPWIAGPNSPCSGWSDVFIHSLADAIQFALSGNSSSTAYTMWYVVEQLA
jgi:hypothetical protein